MTPRSVLEPARLAGSAMLRTQSDSRLVDLVRAGHAAAFEAIVQRYRRQLLCYCSRLLPASRAEDAVQQTFVKAYQAMTSGDADLNLRPWLYRIAHNCSLNLLRQNGFGHEPLDENMDGVQRPDQAFELRERLRSTVRAVNALPSRQREAVLLREVDGLSYEEIAAALGVGDGAVRQLLHRARATLRAGASALTPVGLVERLASALASGGDPVARVTELAAGAGAGVGAVKLGAAVLATGVLATGAVTAVPLRHHERHGSSAHADEAAVPPARASGAGPAAGQPPPAPVDDHSRDRGSGSDSGGRDHSNSGSGGGRDGSSEHGDDRRGSSSGPGDGSSSPGEDRDRGSGERSGSGSGSDDRSRHGGGGGHSGSGSDDSGSHSGPGSGSGGGTDGSDDPGGSSHSGHGGGGQSLTGSGEDEMSTTGGEDDRGKALSAPTDSTGSDGDRSGEGGGSGSGSGR